MAPHKTHLIDKIPWWGAMLLSFGYVLCFIICIGVGANGPAPMKAFTPELLPPTNLQCANPMDCMITYKTSFNGMSGYNQVIWWAISFDRPHDTALDAPALINQQITWSQPFWVSATASDSGGAITTIASNISHAASMTCYPKETTCSYALVFTQAFLYYQNYDVTVVFDSPYRAFVEAGIPAANIDTTTPVVVQTTAGFLAKEYTVFQMTGKYTFFCFSVLMFAGWLTFLWRGRGASNPQTGDKLQFSTDQVWVTVLAFFLIFYNDPTFAANVIKPSWPASGFYAVNSITFIALLMLYWLVKFDSARAENGEASGGVSASISRRFRCGVVASAMVFWLPKILWVTVSWLLILTVYMVSRGAYISDPAFSLFESFPYIENFFYTFLAVWGALYVVYLGVLLLLACGNCKTMRPGGRYVVAITFVSIIAVLVGFFMNGLLTGERSVCWVGVCVF